MWGMTNVGYKSFVFTGSMSPLWAREEISHLADDEVGGQVFPIAKVNNLPSQTSCNNAQKKSELDEISKDHTKVAINQKVKDFSKIKKVVDLSPDLDRQKRIEELKQQINNGTYKVDPGKIAEKIMNNEYLKAKNKNLLWYCYSLGRTLHSSQKAIRPDKWGVSRASFWAGW